MVQLNNAVNFDYNDIMLLPGYNLLDSRSQASTSKKFGNRVFNTPIVPANMSTIIDKELAVELARRNNFYIMHRFNENPIELTQYFQNQGVYASVSFGIKDEFFEYVYVMKKENIIPEYITIDVAHGHSFKVIELVKLIKEELGDKVCLIAGNVGTTTGALELEKAGVDYVKVGIGPGSACLTAPNTGFGTKNHQLSTIYHIKEKLTTAGIIADGGIREYGDIAKSVAFGADMVMIGGFFSGHDENPGDLIQGDNGELYKVFFGSASEHQKGHKKNVEGKKLTIPYKGSIYDTYDTIIDNLQSSISYAGGKEINDLREVEYIILNNK